MPAIENVMKRLGFVKLSKYGLILTPEGRIMTLRPEVLDDGQGGKIVGWRDRDLAAAELARYEAPAVTRAVAIPVAITPPKAFRVSPPIPTTPVLPPLPRAPIPVPPPVVAMNVAPLAEPEEDEWEWEIALARARAVTEEVAAAMMPPVRPSRRNRLDTVPPPAAFIPVKTELGVAPSKPKMIESKTQPMAAVAAPRDSAIASGEWPKTEPLGSIDYDDRTNPMSEVVRVVRLHQAANPVAKIPAKEPTPQRTFVRAPSPSTVIPIPRIPRSEGHSLEPVVRTRFPQATPAPQRSALGISPPPPIRPADDDKTSPGMMAIPPAATQHSWSRPSANPLAAAHVVALPRIPSIVKRAR